MSVGGIIVCSERGAFFSFYSCSWILISWINKNKPPQLLLFLFTFWLLIRFTADTSLWQWKWNQHISDALQWNSHPLLHLRPSSSSFSELQLITHPSSSYLRYTFLSDHLLWSTDCSASLWIVILFLILSTWSQTWYLSEETHGDSCLTRAASPFYIFQCFPRWGPRIIANQSQEEMLLN